MAFGNFESREYVLSDVTNTRVNIQFYDHAPAIKLQPSFKQRNERFGTLLHDKSPPHYYTLPEDQKASRVFQSPQQLRLLRGLDNPTACLPRQVKTTAGVSLPTVPAKTSLIIHIPRTPSCLSHVINAGDLDTVDADSSTSVLINSQNTSKHSPLSLAVQKKQPSSFDKELPSPFDKKLPSPFDKDLPALPVLRYETSAQSCSIFDAIDSTSKKLNYPVLVPEVSSQNLAINMDNPSPSNSLRPLPSPPSLSAEDALITDRVSTTVVASPGVVRIRGSNGIPVRPTRTSLMRESLSQGAGSTSLAPSRSIPVPTGRRNLTTQELVARSFGSPVSRRRSAAFSSRLPQSSLTLTRNEGHTGHLGGSIVDRSFGSSRSNTSKKADTSQRSALGSSGSEANVKTQSEVRSSIDKLSPPLEENDAIRRQRAFGTGIRIRFPGELNEKISTQIRQMNAANKGKGKVVENNLVINTPVTDGNKNKTHYSQASTSGTKIAQRTIASHNGGLRHLELAKKVEVDKAKERRKRVSRLPVPTASSTSPDATVTNGLPQASATSGFSRPTAASTSRTEKKADIFNRAKNSLKKSVLASKHRESGAEPKKTPKKGGMKDRITALLHRRQGPAIEEVQAKEAVIIKGEELQTVEEAPAAEDAPLDASIVVNNAPVAKEDQVVEEVEVVKDIPVIEAAPVVDEVPVVANEAQVGDEDPQRPQDNNSGPSGHAGEGATRAQSIPSHDFIDIFGAWVRHAEAANREMIAIGLALPHGRNRRQVLQDANRIGQQIISARTSIGVAIGALEMTARGIERSLVASVAGMNMAQRLLHPA